MPGGDGSELEQTLHRLRALRLTKDGSEEAGCSRETARKPARPQSEEEARLCRSRSSSNRQSRCRFAPYRLPAKRSCSCGSSGTEEEEGSRAESEF